ncbi:GerMN domain-containing protein [Acetivibrio straminisolvens]|jgi:germination protein M|uniref:Germination (Cortex hydrolysis) and sporulation protein GerM n=1 Tax=Acetivibrio straminisolvens JCM 21531 TaxID=1294263 RepID=W4V2J1_9FIRM|nr:GerMN domain-containing protein [Acetivibrio straminisolvens]GAE87043.1 germination (cortex hydrolysis) and sporulation protein GerM [Acetivibrio straminisolvens JCM 21531]
MKKLTCLVVVLLVTFLYGCQIPTDKITQDENGMNSPNIDKEVMSLDDSLNAENRAGDNVLDTSNPSDDEDKRVLSSTVEPSAGSGEKEDKSEEKTKIAVTVYYSDSDNHLIPLTRDIYKEEGIAKASLKCMVDNDLNRSAVETLGLYPVLPEGTEILGMNIKDGIATIDFNSRILDYKDKTAENNIVAGVVYCLTEFKTIDGVKILIEGMEKEKLQYGTDISGILARDNILINSDKVNLEDKLKKADVYMFKYIKDKNEFILPISMEYIGVSNEQLPAEIIRMLAAKPANERIYSQIPSGVEVLGSRIQGNLLVLDLNKEIKNYGGTAREEGILKQILYSMRQLKNVDKIQILIEGKKDHLPEGTDISREILLPAEINRQKGL